jgi:hypothetical protein
LQCTAEPAHPQQLSDAPRILAIGLHHHRRQRRLHLAGLEQHDLEPGLRQASMQPLRQRAGLEPDPRHHQAELAEEPNQRLGLTRHLGLSDDPSGPIHHAHAALFQ